MPLELFVLLVPLEAVKSQASALAEALQLHDARSTVAARTAHAKLRIIADVEIEGARGYAAKQSPRGCAVYGFGFGGIQPQFFRD